MVRRYEDMRSRERRTPVGIKCSFTFKLHFQHLVLINDVTILAEGVAGTVHTDLQTQISSWWQTIMEKRFINCVLLKKVTLKLTLLSV